MKDFHTRNIAVFCENYKDMERKVQYIMESSCNAKYIKATNQVIHRTPSLCYTYTILTINDPHIHDKLKAGQFDYAEGPVPPQFKHCLRYT